MLKPTGKLPNQGMMFIAAKIVWQRNADAKKRLAINVQSNATWKVYSAKIGYKSFKTVYFTMFLCCQLQAKLLFTP